jgi:transcriptional regulator with XRE-family HTH domain
MLYNMFLRFKKIRQELGLIQEAFATNLGMKQDNYAKIETGKVNPTLKTLIVLHNKYGINLNWLICGSGKMKLTENVNTNYVNEPPPEYGNIYKELAEERKKVIDMQAAEIERLNKVLKECCAPGPEMVKANEG